MKYYIFYEPGSINVISDKRIIETYFDWWSNKMKSVNKSALISEENCIEDFCVVHWATEFK